MATKTETVHRLKVTLRHVRPPVWRRIEVASDITLWRLAAVLEAAMGWWGEHLHAFEVGNQRYHLPDEDFDDLWFGPRPIDEREARLSDVLPTVGSKMRWEYDFGDGWEHDVVVEAVEPYRKGARYPICLKGKRACPPEDSGGPWGYKSLLEVMADPSHPEHIDFVEWLGRDFDPEEFDMNVTTETMRSRRPLHWE